MPSKYKKVCSSDLFAELRASINRRMQILCISQPGSAAWGCAFSMLFELVYHRWSPEYRRGDDIEDPLHVAPFDVDRGEEEDRAERMRVATTHLSKKTLAKIAKHKAEHEKEAFTWPWSTHINLHGAACNGILAGLVGITAGENTGRPKMLSRYAHLAVCSTCVAFYPDSMENRRSGENGFVVVVVVVVVAKRRSPVHRCWALWKREREIEIYSMLCFRVETGGAGLMVTFLPLPASRG